MMTDPIADMLTRIRNASNIERPAVDMPATKLKVAVAKVLTDEGFVLGYRVGKYVETENGKEFQETTDLGQAQVVLQVFLKYGPDYEIGINSGHIRNKNSTESMNKILERIAENLRNVKIE